MTGAVPFKRVVAMTRDDAAEWATPQSCYAIDYVGQAEPGRHRFGAKVYRVWITRPTPALREKWEAA